MRRVVRVAMSSGNHWSPQVAAFVAENIGVEVARAALCEVGRVDLAARVRGGKTGVPTLDGGNIPFELVVVRAFLLGHLAMGHDDHICPVTNGRLAIHCQLRSPGTCAGPMLR